MAAERVSVKDKKIQENLAKNVGKFVEITGIYTGGDCLNKLEGDALTRDIEFQKKVQHRKYLQKEPYIKFRVSDAKMALKDKDAAERLIYQMIYAFTDDDGKDQKVFIVESKTKFTIGYRSGDKLIPIKHASLEGKHFAYGQRITVTYEVYQNKETEECGMGLANIIFDEKPKFFVADRSADKIGTVEGQNWSSEVEDFSDEEGTVTPEPEHKAEVAEGNTVEDKTAEAPADDAGDDADWSSVWS